MKNCKCLLIGWDAAEWELIDRYIDLGLMPNLQSLLRRGVRANIATLQPVLSPLLWTSIATGKRPHEHGVLGFVEWQGKKLIPVQASSRRNKAFWNILEEAGLRTQIINWWPSHPAEQSGKLKVSNQFCEFPQELATWTMSEAAIFPPVRHAEIAELRVSPQELSQAHLQPFFPNHSWEELQTDPLVANVAHVLARSASVHNVITQAIEKDDWDFSAVYLEALDHFSHLASQYLAPKLEGVSDSDFVKYSEIIPAAYRWHDMMLGRLIELAGDDCHFMIVSDHGFEVSTDRSIKLPDLPAAPALEHRPYGVLAASGPFFKKNQALYGASLLDIAPTILSLYNLPLAEDMPGRALTDLYQKKVKPSFIPSWELSGPGPTFSPAEQGNSQAILQQLDDLGYIDLSGADQAQKIKEEWEYNRLLSLFDAGEYVLAWEGFMASFKDKKDFRYLNLGAKLCLEQKDLKAFDAFFENWPTNYSQSALGNYFQATACMIRGEFAKAQEHLINIEHLGMHSAQLYFELGRTAFLLGNLKAAAENYQRCLEINSQYSSALTGLAAVKVEELHYSTALTLLQKSISLRFFQPQAHYLLGFCFKQEEEIEAAIQATKIALKQAPKHSKTLQLLELLEPSKGSKPKPEDVLIVSGFPRSGTSMMMSILGKAGFPLVHDDERVADQSNPKGYFEYEGIKHLAEAPENFKAQPGQVVKVVAPLLRYLPPENSYTIIWMDRPVIELIISQEKMKGNTTLQNFPYQLAMQMEAEQKRILQWIKNQSNMSVFVCQYQDFLLKPKETLAKLSEHFKGDYDWKLAEEEIDSALYRSKIG